MPISRERKNLNVFALCACVAILLCIESLIYSEDAWSRNECRDSRNSHWASYRLFGQGDVVQGKWVITCDSSTYTGVTYTPEDADGNQFPVAGPGAVHYEMSNIPSSLRDEVKYYSGYLLQNDGSVGSGDTRYDNLMNPLANRLWLPKRFTRGACSHASNSGKMCFTEVGRVDADPTGTFYWKLRTNAGVDVGTKTNNEYVDDSTNTNVFIQAGATRRSLGVTEREYVIDGVDIAPIYPRYRLDSANMPESYSASDDSAVAAVDILAGSAVSPSSENLDHTITVQGGATITGGALYFDRVSDGQIFRDGSGKPRSSDRLNAISLKSTVASYSGKLTVNVIDGTVRSHRSLDTTAATPAVGIYVGSGRTAGTAQNPNQVIVKLQDKARVAVRDATVSPGKITTSGDNSPAIWAAATRATSLGSIRINTPLEISTTGAKSHGVRVQSAGMGDALQEATRNRAITAGTTGAATWGGFSFGTLFFHAAGGGNPSSATINALTRAQMIGAFELPGGGDGPRVARLSSADRPFLAHIVAALKDTTVISDAVITAAKQANAVGNSFLYGGTGILGRIFTSKSSDGLIIEINDDSTVDGQPGIATSGPYATAIKGESSGVLSTIWIGTNGDFSDDTKSVSVDHDSDTNTDDVMIYRTRVVVDEPITTTGAESHGVYASIGNARSITVDVRADISVAGEGSKAIKIDTTSASSNTVSIGSGATVTGAIEFGDGVDTLNLTSGTVTGPITGLETLTKTTTGVAELKDDVTFTASTLTVSAGELVVFGALDLGTAGTVTVAEGAVLRLHGALDLGTAGTVTLAADAELRLVVSGAAQGRKFGRMIGGTVTLQGPPSARSIIVESNSFADLEAAGRLFAGTMFQDSEGNTIMPSVVYEVPGDDKDSSYLAAGGLAILWLLTCEDATFAFSAGSTCGTQSSLAGARDTEQYLSGGVQTWAKLYSDSSLPQIQGLAVGMDARVGENSHVSFTAMPSASGAMQTGAFSLNDRSSFEGGHYSVKGRWQRDGLFAGARVLYGAYQASTQFDNVYAAGGKLAGQFGMAHSHLELSSGMRLSAGGVASIIPAVAVYGGTVRQAGHTAGNSLVTTNVPGYRQAYRGWKLGVHARSEKWLEGLGEMKWLPQMGISAYRTSTSGPSSMMLRQRNRNGELSFVGKMAVRGLPKTIHAFRAGVAAEKSSNLQFRVDYVGMEIDGNVQHGAAARVQLRF